MQEELGGEAPADPPVAEFPHPVESHERDLDPHPTPDRESLLSTIPTTLQARNASGAFVEATNSIAQPVAPLSMPAAQRPSSGDLRTAGNTKRTPTARNQCNEAPNKYELLIFPDEHSIVDDPLLRCTPYIINAKYNVLICTDCQHCINPNRASEHLRKRHSHCKVGTRFSTEVTTKFPGLLNETIHPHHVITPVFGLAISKDKYTVCARCGRGYANLSTWSHHVCAKPNAEVEGGQEHFTSHVQTFFLGQNICYFPISLPVTASDDGHRDDFDLFRSAFRDISISEDEVGEPEDYRVLNQFLLKEGWLAHVSGYSISELHLLTTPPQENEILQPIAKEVFGLMSDIQASIGSAGYHVRRLLGKRPS